MDFTIPPDSRLLAARIRAFVDERVQPLEVELSSPFRELEPRLRGLRDEARSICWNPQMSRAHGGLELSLLEFAHISEAMGRTPFGHYVFNCQAPDAGNLSILTHFANSDHDQFIQPLAAGTIRSCFAMTEPDQPGSNPRTIKTSAQLVDGNWIINGHKWFTTGADGATFAIVVALTEPDEPNPHKRHSLIIVPCDTPGFKIVRNISVMGHAGDGWPSHSEVLFENVTVPAEFLLGRRGGGFEAAQDRLAHGRIHHCTRWIGICERVYEMMCIRAGTRMISGSRPLGAQQTIQNFIAESRAEIDAARLSVLHAAWHCANSNADSRVVISSIKFFVADILQRVLDRALQVHGALGMTDDTPIAWWYRQERAARIYDGPDEVHKSLVARLELRQHGFEIPS